jgi:hypothetical protein
MYKFIKKIEKIIEKEGGNIKFYEKYFIKTGFEDKIQKLLNFKDNNITGCDFELGVQENLIKILKLLKIKIEEKDEKELNE